MAGYTGKTGPKVSSESVTMILGISIPLIAIFAGISLWRGCKRGCNPASDGQVDRDVEVANRARQGLGPRRRGNTQQEEGLPSYANIGQTQLVAQNDVLYNTPAAFDLVSAIAAGDTTNSSRNSGGGTTNHGRTSLTTNGTSANAGPDPSTLTSLQKMRRAQRLVGELNNMMSAAPSEGYKCDSVEMVKIVKLRTGIAALMEPNSHFDDFDSLVQQANRERIPSAGQDGGASASGGTATGSGSGPMALAEAGSGGSGSGDAGRTEPGIGPEGVSSIAFPQPIHYQIPGSSPSPPSPNDDHYPGRQGTLPPPYEAVVATSSDRREEASAAVR